MIIDRVFKFTPHEFEVENDYDRGAVLFQGEGEITEMTDKSIGRDDSVKRVYRLRPKIVMIQPADHGTFQEPETTTPKNKSLSKRLYDVLYIYWSQQLTSKYPNFDEFREMWMNKKIDEIKNYLE